MENKGTTIHCLICDSYITGDRKGNFISCKCGACYIDETPDYCRIGGDFDKIEVEKVSSDSIRTWVKISETNKKESEPIKRRDKINYYLDIAETVSERSTCLKRTYGAIIVNNDEIISSGFNGAPRGVTSCMERNSCLREKSERGTDYSNCLSAHAEMNAIISASRQEMIGGTLYLVGKDRLTKNYIENPSPCSICKRLIINAGIKEVIVRTISDEVYIKFNVSDWKEQDIIGGY